MNYILPLLLFVFVSASGSCQVIDIPINQSTNQIIYKRQESTTAKKERLFLISKEWVSAAFKNYREVVQLEDKDLGKLYLNGSVGSDYTPYGYVRFRILIDVADDVWRFILTDAKQSYRRGPENDLELLYAKYLMNYNEMEKLKKQLSSASISKREAKKLKEKIFDQESSHIALTKEVNSFNKELSSIADSFQSFMTSRLK